MGRGGGVTVDVGRLKEQVKEGSDAEQHEKVLEGYFETLETNIVEKWKQTHSIDKDAREELWRQYHSLSEMRRSIKQKITHGKQALKKLEDMK